MLQQIARAVAGGGITLIRSIFWVTEEREQQRGSSVTVHRGTAVCKVDLRLLTCSGVFPQEFKVWFIITIAPQEDVCAG